MIIKSTRINYKVELRKDKYSYKRDGNRVCGVKKCYEYAWNSSCRPKRSEFNKVMREYSKLVQDTLISSGNVTIPNIGTYKIVAFENDNAEVLDKNAMAAYKKLYPNRGDRIITRVVRGLRFRISFRPAKGIYADEVCCAIKRSFANRIREAYSNNKLFFYNRSK